MLQNVNRDKHIDFCLLFCWPHYEVSVSNSPWTFPTIIVKKKKSKSGASQQVLMMEVYVWVVVTQFLILEPVYFLFLPLGKSGRHSGHFPSA